MKTIRTDVRTQKGVGLADVHVRLQEDGHISDGLESTIGKNLYSLIFDAAGGEIRFFPICAEQLDKMVLDLQSMSSLIR